MKPFNTPLVEPSLTHVVDFAAQNGKPTDVMTFHLKDGDLRDHYRDVVAFVGFGPRGFSELIYFEACNLAKAEKRAIDDLVVRLSPDFFSRIGEFLPAFMKCSLKIVVASGLSGVGYALSFSDSP